MTPEDERAFWDSLEGEEILNNTAGFPPYDVVDVADMICLRMDGGGGGVVLDLGCGYGRLTEMVAEMTGWWMEGVDISPSFIELAVNRSQTNSIYRLGDGRNIPAEIEFDHAYSVTTLQHIPDDAKWGYLRQVQARLPRGGRFVFTVAVGEEPPTFLNHQIADIQQFGNDLMEIYDQVSIDETDVRGWTWVTVWA